MKTASLLSFVYFRLKSQKGINKKISTFKICLSQKNVTISNQVIVLYQISKFTFKGVMNNGNFRFTLENKKEDKATDMKKIIALSNKSKIEGH